MTLSEFKKMVEENGWEHRDSKKAGPFDTSWLHLWHDGKKLVEAEISGDDVTIGKHDPKTW